MTDATTYGAHGPAKGVKTLPTAGFLEPVNIVSSDLLGLIILVSIIILLLSEGNILLGIIS